MKAVIERMAALTAVMEILGETAGEARDALGDLAGGMPMCVCRRTIKAFRSEFVRMYGREWVVARLAELKRLRKAEVVRLTELKRLGKQERSR